MLNNKFFSNISWLLFDKLIRIFGNLFIGIWVAKYLGPHDYGILNYSLSYIYFFTIFVNLGLEEIAIREIVKTPKLTRYILGTSFGMKLLGSIVALTLVIISLDFIDTDNLTKATILIVSFSFVFQAFDVIDYFYRAKILSKYVVIARNSAFIIFSLMQVYFIYYDYGIIYFAISYLTNIALSALFLFLIYHYNSESLKTWRFSRIVAFRLLKDSWPLALSTFLIVSYSNIDQIMIGNILSIEDVGIYSVAVKLCEVWYFIPGILISTFMPYLISLKDKNYKLFEYRLYQFYSFMFWLGFIVGMTVFFAGESLIVFLYGDMYKESYNALALNIWNGMFLAQAMVRGIWLLSENLQRYRLYITAIMLILNIILNYILIPIYGISGAAFATVMTQFLGTWILPMAWSPLRKNNLIMFKSINPLYLLRK